MPAFPRTPLPARALLLGLLTLAACGKQDCAKLPVGDARDACYFGEVAVAADKDRLDDATTAVGHIDAALSRAAAIRKLIAANPRGMTDEKAKALCAMLEGEDATACMKTWDRPHLWNQ